MFLTVDNKIKWNWIAWGAVVTAILVACGIVWFDRPLFLAMRELDCRAWALLDKIFDAKVWILVSFVAVLVFCIKKCVKTDCKFLDIRNKSSVFAFLYDFFVNTRTNNAFLIFCSVVSAGILVKVLKIFIGRARPIFFEALDMTGFFPPSTDWVFNSMPSGHTTVTFAGLVMIGMLAPRFKPLTWTLAIIVGVSRVAIGAHWPSDVILGAFIGMVVADIVKAMLLKK
ncbi:MAG: phosphatase PAP2 family protein [Alphaproteobacteria bacterium]|nr:phosphatase PAP2 family protein [Alphaproteobacteria bacterium]